MKYIPAEKLIAEIERRLKIVEPHKDTFESAAACRQELIWMKEFITSLQQEQPSLPSNLNEVAEKYAEDTWLAGDNWGDAARRTFKAGAEWMASRGEQEQPEVDLEKERKNLNPTMLTYAAEVFGGKTLLEDISYSYRRELADYFNGLVKAARKEE